MTYFLEQTLYRISENIQSGGMVMIPLMLVSVVMWVLIIHKAFYFKRLREKNITRKTAGEYVSQNRAPDPNQYPGITSHFVREFINRRSGDRTTDQFILDETVMHIVAMLDRHLSAIGVLAGVAPLLGLLGTVMGMMTTFDIISVYGTGNAKAMAGGISEALITTQTGLLVAIPGIYMKTFLTRRAENLKQQISALGIYLKRFV
ncbi:MAG: MotA/TolQ/ExbB proton channel family protein [Desulfobacterales bacterium]|nr:MotA/TolQ/ExbB proton channel family protein [Desulfobacterales bacterium]MDD4073203.1 MotA/TolQ/ExbB proton channel family protein [Desulfobacterales bacterium]MDD4393976.1 MotA/TolQ/ExbB proton channel family protein [Desulfobacterales bacterium]